MKLEQHPFSRLVPPMQTAEYEALVKDLRERGQQFPIITYENMVLDGWHREQACAILGLKPQRVAFGGSREDAIALVLSANVHRRHLTYEQRVAIAEQELRANPAQKDGEIAEKAGVSRTTVLARRHALGVEANPRKRPTKVDHDPAIAEAIRAGKTQAQIKADLRVGSMTVQRVRRQLADVTHDISGSVAEAEAEAAPVFRSDGRRWGGRGRPRAVRVKQIAELLEEGYSIPQVADLIGIHERSVRLLITEQNIAVPEWAKARKAKRAPAARILEETVNAMVGMAHGLELARGGEKISMSKEHAAALLAEARPAMKSIQWAMTILREIANG